MLSHLSILNLAFYSTKCTNESMMFICAKTWKSLVECLGAWAESVLPSIFFMSSKGPFEEQRKEISMQPI